MFSTTININKYSPFPLPSTPLFFLTTSVGAIFDEADTNNNGKISVRELKAFLTKKGVNCWSEKQFKDMFRDGDTSRDG